MSQTSPWRVASWWLLPSPLCAGPSCSSLPPCQSQQHIMAYPSNRRRQLKFQSQVLGGRLIRFDIETETGHVFFKAAARQSFESKLHRLRIQEQFVQLKVETEKNPRTIIIASLYRKLCSYITFPVFLATSRLTLPITTLLYYVILTCAS